MKNINCLSQALAAHHPQPCQLAHACVQLLLLATRLHLQQTDHKLKKLLLHVPAAQELIVELRASRQIIGQVQVLVAEYEQQHSDKTSDNITLLFKIAELERRLADAARQLHVAQAARTDVPGGGPIAGQPSLTLLQQTQHEAANLHARLTAAQHATAALTSELDCARSERDLVLHDNAALTQHITALESELQARAEAAEQVAAEASELGQCLRSLASLGAREGGVCSGGGSDGGSGSGDGGSSIHGSRGPVPRTP